MKNIIIITILLTIKASGFSYSTDIKNISVKYRGKGEVSNQIKYLIKFCSDHKCNKYLNPSRFVGLTV